MPFPFGATNLPGPGPQITFRQEGGDTPAGGVVNPLTMTADPVVVTGTLATLSAKGQTMTATAVVVTGTIVKQVNKAVTGTAVAVTATASRQVNKFLTATTVGVTASLLAQKVKLVAMTATSVLVTASMVKQVNKALTATAVAVTASMVRQVNKLLTATTVLVTATMVAIKVFLRTLTATSVVVSASMSRQVNKLLTATAVVVTASMVRRVNKTVTGTAVVVSASIIKQIGKLLTGTASAVTATIARLKVKTQAMSATVSVTASISTVVTHATLPVYCGPNNTGLLDGFDRPDGDPGANWSDPYTPAPFTIHNNMALFGTFASGANFEGFGNGWPMWTDSEIFVTFVGPHNAVDGDHVEMGLFRAPNLNSGYSVVFSSTGMSIRRYDQNAVFTALTGTAGTTMQVGDAFCFTIAAGTFGGHVTLTASLNRGGTWQTILTVVDDWPGYPPFPDLQGNNGPLIPYLYTEQASLDNFGGGAISKVGPYGTPIFDNFDRADGPIGANWNNFGANQPLTITSNQTTPPVSAPLGVQGFYTPNPMQFPCEMFVAINRNAPYTGGDDTEFGFANITGGAFNGYIGYWIGGVISITRVPDYTNLVSVPFTILTGDRMGVSFDGQTVQLWLYRCGAWRVLLQAVDPNPHVGPFSPWLWTNRTDLTYDDPGGGKLTDHTTLGPQGTPVLDNFNRPNGYVGSNWGDLSNPTHLIHITANEIFARGGSGSGQEGFGGGFHMSPPCEVWASFGVGMNITGNTMTLGLELPDDTNYLGYTMSWDGSTVTVQKDFTWDVVTPFTHTLITGDRLGLSYDGLTLVGWHWRNGVWTQICSGVDDGTLGGGPAHGGPFVPYYFTNFNNFVLDDMGGGVVPTQPPTPSYVSMTIDRRGRGIERRDLWYKGR